EDIDVLEGSEITTFDSVIVNNNPDLFTALDIVAGAEILIGSDSAIHVDGKGYPGASIYWPNYQYGCHAGTNVAKPLFWPLDSCAYGRYSEAAFAGSGRSNLASGGLMTITAQALNLSGNARVSANASDEGLSSGGAINIDVVELFGTEQTLIAARGADGSNGRGAGGGGRVVINSENRLAYVGQTDTSGGNSTYILDQTEAGAGTLLFKDRNPALASDVQWHLRIDNTSRRISRDPVDESLSLHTEIKPAHTSSTPIKSVGRSLITEVTPVDGSTTQWRISVASTGTGFPLYQELNQRVAYPITISGPRNRLVVGSSASRSYVFRRDKETFIEQSQSDFIFRQNIIGTGRDRAYYPLSAGDYWVVFSDEGGLDTDLGSNTATTDQFWVEIDTIGPWRETDLKRDRGVQGLYVDLDASTDEGPFYRIVENTTDSLIVEVLPDDDLNSVLNNDLIGVHQLASLQVKGGASVDFGGDRLILDDVISRLSDDDVQSVVEDAELRNTELTRESMDYFASNNQSGRFYYENMTEINPLVVDEPIVFNSNGFSFEHLQVNGSMDMNSAEMEVRESITVTGDLTLNNGSVITVPDTWIDTNFPARVIYDLDLRVGGTLTLENENGISASRLDVSGKGYPNSGSNRWPNFSASITYLGCHGGLTYAEDDPNCAYGRYTQARFAGNSGGGDGGGIMNVRAGAIVLNGSFDAVGYAGGSIHIEVDESLTIGEHGLVNASAEDQEGINAIKLGGGGRISVIAPIVDFAVNLDSHFDASGASNSLDGANNREMAGAGTVFIQPPVNIDSGLQAPGRLLVFNDDNFSNFAAVGSTPIESIGRHSIFSVVQEDPNSSDLWRITVSTDNPWVSGDPKLDLGIQGLWVDLDISDEMDDRHRVISNDSNSFVLQTMEDLSSSFILGDELVGVHEFESLDVGGGASVDFGGDLIILPGGLSLDQVSEFNAAPESVQP
ncbi:MAG: hypothetical protein COA42_24145, partial [Alteromonadaceae bacterium]